MASAEEVTVEMLISDMFEQSSPEIGDLQLIESSGTDRSAGERKNNRFEQISAADIDQFLEEQANANTKKKTNGDIKLFSKFLMSKGEQRLMEFIPGSDLNTLISEFLLSVRKADGYEYEPSSLRAFVSSFDRHLREKGYGLSVMKDIQFEKSRQVLKMKQKDLKKQGKGNKPNAADPLTDDDISKMFAAKTIGDSNPHALIHSLWMICTVQFGMRTGQEVHDLKWGDVQLKIDSNGDEYILYDQERQTKTRTGANARDVRLTKPWAYAIPESQDKDPVHLYKAYKMRRPHDMLESDSPFFLSVLTRSPKPGQCWFKKKAMGINKLYGIMKDITVEAGLTATDKRITPYSARKHLVQKLNDAGVAPNQIIQISGHKNVNSLNNYSRLNPDQSKRISNLLANKPLVKPESTVVIPEAAVSTIAEQKFSNLPMQGSGSFFANSVFHGTVNISFENKSERQTLTQTAYTCSARPNEESPKRERKRIRTLCYSSESDSQELL